MRQKVLANMLHEVLKQGISVVDVDDNAFVWPSSSMETVFAWLLEKHVVIQGGRMYLRSENTIFFSGLEWSIERNELDWEGFVREGMKVARAFVQRHQASDEEHFFVLDTLDEEELFIRERLPGGFPEAFVDTAICFANWVSWTAQDAVQAISYYASRRYIISNVEVYHMNENGMLFRDVWLYLKKGQESIVDVENSKDQAIAYIEDYRAKYGEDYCYVPGVILV